MLVFVRKVGNICLVASTAEIGVVRADTVTDSARFRSFLKSDWRLSLSMPPTRLGL